MFIAVAAVGSSSFFVDTAFIQPPSNTAILGSLCAKLVAEVLLALKVTLEQVMTHDKNMHTLVVVGLEGSFGFVLTLGIFWPIAHFTPGKEGTALHEDIIDTFLMLRNSRVLVGLAVASVVVLLVFNLCLMTVVATTNAVIATFYELARIATLWVIQVVLYYSLEASKYSEWKVLGEKWTRWSWLELAGFVMMGLGIFFYKGIIRIPCLFTYTKIDQDHYPYERLPTKHATNGMETSGERDESDFVL